MRRPLVMLTAAGLLLAGGIVAAALPASAAPVICEKFGTTTVSGGRYVVQNNNWGDDTTQCIDVNQSGPGFNVTTASHNKATNGAPGSYPSVYFGCHYANCSSGSGLPMQASTSTFAGIRSTVTMSYPSAGVWDAAYDIWFDPTPRTDGQNTGAEIMIWLNKQGSIQPVGSQVGTANINGATWNVWFGNIGWNVVSYVRQSATTSMNFVVNDFFSDAVNRGHAQRNWYLTSIQAGFEPWVGQTNLAVTAFSVTTGPPPTSTPPPTDTTAPSAPANLAASGVTANSVNLSWSASTDNVGVVGYDVLRATGTSGGSFSQVGTSTGTSFAASGLSPSTAYRYQVRARDAAGNTSAVSNTVTVTTSSGGGGGGACSAAYRVVNAWGGAFQGEVVVTNTSGSTLNGWTVNLAFGQSVTITQIWGGTATGSGSSATIKPLSYTANPNPTATFGFIANTNGASGATATATCTSP